MDQKPFLIRILDEHAQIVPVSGVIVAGALGFVIVLSILLWFNGPKGFGRFIPLGSQKESDVIDKASVLAALSAHNPPSIVTPAQKLAILKSLAQRVDSGEQKIFVSEQDKLKVLASLSTAH